MLAFAHVDSFYDRSHILHDVCLDVPDGKITAVLGRNGTGKTTLLKTLMGLTDRMDGEIRLDDADLGRRPTFQRARAGIAYVRREWAERLRPVMVGWNSVVNAFDFNTIDYTPKPHAGKWEGGSYNVPGLTALGASLELLLAAGIENVCGRVTGLTDYLCEKAASAGLGVFSSRADGEKSGIVSLASPGRDPVALLKRCRAAGVVVNVRHHRLRVSPHAYNTEDEIDRFLDAVRSA